MHKYKPVPSLKEFRQSKIPDKFKGRERIIEYKEGSNGVDWVLNQKCKEEQKALIEQKERETLAEAIRKKKSNRLRKRERKEKEKRELERRKLVPIS